MPGSFRSKVDVSSRMTSRTSLNSEITTTNSLLKATSSESIDIIERRNFAWKGLIRDIEKHFEELYNVYYNASKGLERAALLIESPDKDPGLLLDSNKLGVLKLVSTMRDAKLQLADSYTKSAQDALGKADLLRQLREEIKQRNKNMRNEHTSLNYKLSKALDSSPNFQISNLDPEVDPWLNSISIQRQLHQVINDENNCNKSISLSFNSLEGFDASILKRIKSIVNGHLSERRDGLSRSSKTIEHVKKISENVPDDIEWKGFRNRFPDIVPINEPEIRTIEDGAIKDLTSVKEGYLGKKTGLFKSWKSFFCVLTSTGFLHGFASKDFTCDSIPDFSINLRKSLISVPTETDRDSLFTFEITDTATGGIFSNEKVYLLKAESKNDCKNWIDSFSSILERGKNNKFSLPNDVKRESGSVGSKMNSEEEVKSKLNRNVSPVKSYSDLQKLSKTSLGEKSKNSISRTDPRHVSTKSQLGFNVRDSIEVSLDSIDIPRDFKSPLSNQTTLPKSSNRDPYYDNPYNINVPILDHQNKALPTPPSDQPRKLNPIIINNKPLPDSPHSSPSPLTPNRNFNFPVPPPISQLTANLVSPVSMVDSPLTYSKINSNQ